MLASVWEHGKTISSAADITYSYAFGNATTPTVVTTKTLNDESRYITSVMLYRRAAAAPAVADAHAAGRDPGHR